MIFSADEDKKCVGCYAASSDAAVAAGGDAREWVTAALGAMGGKTFAFGCSTRAID
jgi:hypothetical protein